MKVYEDDVGVRIGDCGTRNRVCQAPHRPQHTVEVQCKRASIERDARCFSTCALPLALSVQLDGCSCL